MKNPIATTALLCLVTIPALGQHSRSIEPDRVISFPDVPGFTTLKVDLHIHTVFSDGSVWPNIRVQEALRDGLDAIALTEHVEYQPHKDDIPHPDRNRSHNIATDSAENSGLIIIQGSEITRDMPPGHSNAVFVTDSNRLLKEDVMAVFREARRQDAFTFWNHPNWTAHRKDGTARLSDIHVRLIEEGLISGIEVVNETTYSDEAVQIALDHNLTMIGTSDIHGLVDWRFNVGEGGHRPVTLVFAKVRSAEGIQEALIARRTAVWFKNTLIGREEHVIPLIKASLEISRAWYGGDTSVLSVLIRNHSDAEFILQNRSSFTFHEEIDVFSVDANDEMVLNVKTLGRLDSVSLNFEVLNTVTAPNTHPIIQFDIKPEKN